MIKWEQKITLPLIHTSIRVVNYAMINFWSFRNLLYMKLSGEMKWVHDLQLQWSLLSCRSWKTWRRQLIFHKRPDIAPVGRLLSRCRHQMASELVVQLWHNKMQNIKSLFLMVQKLWPMLLPWADLAKKPKRMCRAMSTAMKTSETRQKFDFEMEPKITLLPTCF